MASSSSVKGALVVIEYNYIHIQLITANIHVMYTWVVSTFPEFIKKIAQSTELVNL